MAEDEAFRAPSQAKRDRLDADDYRKCGELNPLGHLLPEAGVAEYERYKHRSAE